MATSKATEVPTAGASKGTCRKHRKILTAFDVEKVKGWGVDMF
jgi:hypothetical protein